MLYRSAAALLLGLGVLCAIHSFPDKLPVRGIESELRVSLFRLTTTFVSLAASPSSTAFPRRGVCQVEKQSLYSVMGASPMLQLPSSQVALNLVDREYFSKILGLHQKHRIAPSAPSEMGPEERSYWSAFMRCQESEAVYQTASGNRIENLSDLSSFYFCFHAEGNRLNMSQPVLVEAVYTPYNMDIDQGSSKDPYITCSHFHRREVAQRRLGRLRYSVYWTEVAQGNKRVYRHRERTYVSAER